MPVERTLSIIKPDATKRNHTGAIVDRFEKAGLRVIGASFPKNLALDEHVVPKTVLGQGEPAAAPAILEMTASIFSA